MGEERAGCASLSKRILILVEGQTEERFVKDVLAPHFLAAGVYLSATILVTKKVKDGPNFKGGITSFRKFEEDLNRLIHSDGAALVTTILDYYGLPEDFPGMSTRSQHARPEERVRHVEAAVHRHFGARRNLVPFFALHEFESWMFSSLTVLPEVVNQPELHQQFAAVRSSFPNPEHINERPDFAPSKRIRKLFSSYRKPLHGPIAAGRIGLSLIRAECPHFNDWFARLEAFAGTIPSTTSPASPHHS
jgi:hypothetical protein